MDPGIMVMGLLIDIVGGLIAAWLLCLALPRCQTYLKRVLFVLMLGVFISVIVHLGYWNWMHFSWSWTFGFIVDNLVGWGLAGLAMAAIMKSASSASDAAEPEAA